MRVGDIQLSAGTRQAYDAFGGAAALIVERGEGTINISGSAHVIGSGSVELVCVGESCEIAATSAVHVYIVIAKE